MTNLTNIRTGSAGLAKAALTRPRAAACPQMVGTGAIEMVGTGALTVSNRLSLAERWKV